MFTWQKKAIKTKANKPRDRNEKRQGKARRRQGNGTRPKGGGAILRTNVEIQVKQGSFSFTSLWPKVITQKSV